jgi:SAM-dependent methyltransferase
MFMDPSQILSLAHLKPNDSVADFGAGSGFLARAASALVPQGNVFAVEINKDIVARLNREVLEMSLGNMHPLWGDVEVAGGSKIANNSIDFLILSNVMFHLEDKAGCLKEVIRVLKPDGRVLLVDWQESFGGMGPSPQFVFNKSSAEEFFSKFGFTKVTDSLPAGDHHYAIIFKK